MSLKKFKHYFGRRIFFLEQRELVPKKSFHLSNDWIFLETFFCIEFFPMLVGKKCVGKYIFLYFSVMRYTIAFVKKHWGELVHFFHYSVKQTQHFFMFQPTSKGITQLFVTFFRLIFIRYFWEDNRIILHV